MRDALHDFEFDQFVGQEPQRPSRAALGRTTATEGDELGLGLAVDDSLSRSAGGGPAFERRLQTLLDEPASDALHRIDRDCQRCGNLFVGPPRVPCGPIRVQQDPSMCELSGGPFAVLNQTREIFSFGLLQANHVTLRHRVPPCVSCLALRQATTTQPRKGRSTCQAETKKAASTARRLLRDAFFGTGGLLATAWSSVVVRERLPHAVASRLAASKKVGVWPRFLRRPAFQG